MHQLTSGNVVLSPRRTDNNPLNKQDPLGLSPSDCSEFAMGGCRYIVHDSLFGAYGEEAQGTPYGDTPILFGGACYKLEQTVQGIRAGAMDSGYDVRTIYAIFASELGNDPCDEYYGDLAGDLGFDQQSRGPMNLPANVWDGLFAEHGDALTSHWSITSGMYGSTITKGEAWEFLAYDQRYASFASGLHLKALDWKINGLLGGDIKPLNPRLLQSKLQSEPNARYYFESALLGAAWYGGAANADGRLRQILDGGPDDWARINQQSMVDSDGDQCYENRYHGNFNAATDLYSVGSAVSC